MPGELKNQLAEQFVYSTHGIDVIRWILPSLTVLENGAFSEASDYYGSVGVIFQF